MVLDKTHARLAVTVSSATSPGGSLYDQPERDRVRFLDNPKKPGLAAAGCWILRANRARSSKET